MSPIGVGNCSKYNLYILIAVITEFVTDYIFGLNSSNQAHPGRLFPFTPTIKNHPFFKNFIFFQSNIFAVSSSIIYKKNILRKKPMKYQYQKLRKCKNNY